MQGTFHLIRPIVLTSFAFAGLLHADQKVSAIIYDASVPQLTFAANKITATARAQVDVRIAQYWLPGSMPQDTSRAGRDDQPFAK